MSVRVNDDGFARIERKLKSLLLDMTSDLQAAGEAAAESIVQHTLAGVGSGDKPFAPYSAGYQAAIGAVGGKPQGAVNLRGMFYKSGQKQAKFRSDARRQQYRADRQAFIGVSFGGTSFTARTGVTRPAKGVTDDRSEMSLDLIRVAATPRSLTLTYTPRKADYMIAHHYGRGVPQREWFTLNRRGTQAAMEQAVADVLAARVRRFNARGG